MKLADDGMVDASPTGAEIPLLHFSTNFELLGAKDIARRLEMFAEPDDFRNIDPAEFYDDDYLGEGEPRRNAEAWLQSHEPYLGQEQAAALRELFARPLIVRDDDSMGFLEFAEVDELVDPVLRYPERHEPILLWDRG